MTEQTQNEYARIHSGIEEAVKLMDEINIDKPMNGKRIAVQEIQICMYNLARDMSGLVGVLSPDYMEKLKLKYDFAKEYVSDKLKIIYLKGDIMALLNLKYVEREPPKLVEPNHGN
jgi:hypothetical protein